MKERFEPSIQETKNSLEKGIIGAIEYERFHFTPSQVEKLKGLNFPLDITEQTLITEIHLKHSDGSTSEIRDSIKKVASGKEGYTIGVSWLAPALRRFGFTVEDISEEIAKQFPAGTFVAEQDRIAKEFIEKIEMLEDKADSHPEENIEPTITEAEMTELQQMRGTLSGYEKIMTKLGGKVNYKDIRLAWIRNQDL